jgi:hypothetical protein
VGTPALATFAASGTRAAGTAQDQAAIGERAAVECYANTGNTASAAVAAGGRVWDPGGATLAAQTAGPGRDGAAIGNRTAVMEDDAGTFGAAGIAVEC